jgi:hypothetical protein
VICLHWYHHHHHHHHRAATAWISWKDTTGGHRRHHLVFVVVVVLDLVVDLVVVLPLLEESVNIPILLLRKGRLVFSDSCGCDVVCCCCCCLCGRSRTRDGRKGISAGQQQARRPTFLLLVFVRKWKWESILVTQPSTSTIVRCSWCS